MSKETRPSRGGRGGIQVKTISRAVSGRDETASGSSRASTVSHQRTRMRKPSVRYREKALGATRPGENFFPDAKMAEEFEKRVLEIYAPTPDFNESTRDLPLKLQAERDGIDFRLPKLGQMCLEIASDHFATRILPLLQRDEQQNRSSSTSYAPLSSARRRKKRKVGIFGLPVDDEDDDGDFVPDSNDTPSIVPKAKKSRGPILSRTDREILEDVHESNSYILSIMPIAARESLQRMLEKKSPQHLSCYVLNEFFLTKSMVQASKTIRALSTVGGIGDRGILSLLRTLSMPVKESSRPAAVLEKLHLQAFTRLTTQQLLPLFETTVNLREVCLRGCISVDAGAIKRLVESSGKTLKVINLNWTGVRAGGVEAVIRGCPGLEVLKVAHVQNLDDASVTAMMDRITRDTIGEGIIPLAQLKKLKIAGTHIGIIGLGSLLKHCGNKLESLDISYTRVGGEGALEILSMLLGFPNQEFGSRQSPLGLNKFLRKLNLSGLSLPQEDLFSLPLVSLTALRVFDFREMRTRPQDSGSHDLALGVKSSLLTHLIIGLGSRASEGFAFGEDHLPSYDRISISNKIIMDKDDRLELAFHLFHLISIKHLDFSGANLSQGTWHESAKSGSSGCEILNLSGCVLPGELHWETFGAAGRLHRIDLSGTKVSEQDVERLVKMNPYLVSINLTGCRGISVTRRRKYFETMPRGVDM